MKQHFLVKLSIVEKAESARHRTVKILMKAEGYTDAEKTGIEIYNSDFKKDYNNPQVSAIQPESFNLHQDFLKPEDVETDAEFSRIYKIKLAVVFKGESSKRMGKTMLVRTTGIEDAIKEAQVSAKKFYDAESVEAVSVTETDIYPLSPIFDPVEEEKVTKKK